ncbi:glucosamine-6-phosphate deaminase [Salirhabdus euzebyi]|uniref:Glucosamine-6-phosphate deaminase n=1 Tax=Salirhabdus euzebyi TaxID=394506 RepID=A0A841Q5N6_9BACI|nr:glucosamine-6-phosphate deaminase [Salirhabdus euzebyi]MBB6453694.1 glucosamine-6-phosphate deaminase [Salirhabdus euzebyi]
MKVVAVRDYQEMSDLAAKYIIQQVKKKPSSVLGLATGSTPKGTYQKLIEDAEKNGTSYAQVRTINLDEYVGLGQDHPQSYRYFMKANLFNHIDILKKNTYVPNGKAFNLDEECQCYEQLVRSIGVDLQLLGIGVNGHIGFNEPGTPFHSSTHIVKLADSTRKANSRFFETVEEVPKSAITMGIDSILQSKEIVLLASGSKKADALQKLVSGKTEDKFPASALKLHPNVTLIADYEALAKVPQVVGSIVEGK